ncbi:MAG TPA: threonine synthase, partial [Methylophilaceae bacterium]|nr:threonine synthase [Methylophilaceae bacterium]
NTHHTSSPSMDISKASNFERFVFDLVGRDAAKMRELWDKVDKGGAVDLNGGGYFDKVANYGMVSGSSSHADRMKTIRRIFEQYGVVIDTHTADAAKVALEYHESHVPMVVLETALPAKFEDAIVEALGQRPERPNDLVGLEDLPQRFDVMDADVAAIKQFIVDHAH